MTAVFVTSTGTDVGKTFVTAGLIRQLRLVGRAGEAIKPIVTGFDAARRQASDPAQLLDAMGRPLSDLDRICRWRFAAPLSPAMAAQREGNPVVFNALVEFCRRAVIGHKDTLFIEGIGGIMVPIDESRTVLDWMTALRLPLLLVVGSYVGTISHTLTALQVLARRNLEIAGVVVSESADSAATLDETVSTIAHFADSIDVIGVPRLPSDVEAGSQPAFARILAML
jgi:dethiobiotin synthetase